MLAYGTDWGIKQSTDRILNSSDQGIHATDSSQESRSVLGFDELKRDSVTQDTMTVTKKSMEALEGCYRMQDSDTRLSETVQDSVANLQDTTDTVQDSMMNLQDVTKWMPEGKEGPQNAPPGTRNAPGDTQNRLQVKKNRLLGLENKPTSQANSPGNRLIEGSNGPRKPTADSWVEVVKGARNKGRRGK